MMPIEEMMFDAPASIKAEQAHAPWLTKALDKRLLAGKPGIENHRIAQQQLVMAVIAQQQQIFFVNHHFAPQPAPQPQDPIHRSRQTVEIVQRQAGGIKLAVSAGFPLQPGIQPEPRQPHLVCQPQQIIHQ